MTRQSFSNRNRAFVLTGLAVALLIAALLSPFASSNPDGLDRVSIDHGFDARAVEAPPSHNLPFYNIFDEYALRGVPETIATPLAGILGTLATFGLAWGIGKLVVRGRSGNNPDDRSVDSDLTGGL